MLINVMETISQALIHTPLWVYLLFIYLMIIGVKASKSQIVSLRRIFIIPIIFTVLSIHTLLTSFTLNNISIGTWSAAIILGIAFGYWQVYGSIINIDKKHLVLKIPGTWSTLIIILFIFSSKYYMNYELAMNPTILHQTNFELFMLSVSGICTGLFIGRLVGYLYKFNTQPQSDLWT